MSGEESQFRSCEVFAPGRINLIGEHIDYCDGIVLPTAIDQGIFLRGEAIDYDLVKVTSKLLDDEKIFPLDTQANDVGQWSHYISAVVKVLIDRDHKLGGVNLIIESTLPIGSGLSSSSALIIGTIEVFEILYELEISDIEKVDIAREVEQKYIGVNGGIMDQYAIVYSKKDSVIKLDCLDKQHSYLNFEVDQNLLYIVNSNVPHNLAESEYNTRRNQCNEILEKLEVSSFRDLEPGMLEDYKVILNDSVLSKRLTHILTEFVRVDKVIAALPKKDYETVKKAINECQISLRDNYEVSCPQIDYLIAHFYSQKISARMMGGGFGGSILVWLENPSQVQYIEEILIEYNQHFKLEASYSDFTTSNGVHSLFVIES